MERIDSPCLLTKAGAVHGVMHLIDPSCSTFAMCMLCLSPGQRANIVDPYAKPRERKIGTRRPKIRHVAQSVDPRTRRERQAEKQGIIAERRAIKKAARRHLKEQLLREFDEAE